MIDDAYVTTTRLRLPELQLVRDWNGAFTAMRTNVEHAPSSHPESPEIAVDMPKPAIDASSLIRVGTYTAELERLHLWGTDEEIDGEFNSVCRTIWGYTLDDFDDDRIPKEDHDWLDGLTARRLIVMQQ